MKKILCVLMILALCAFSALVFAENTLSVTGKGESFLTAETAYVSLGVQARSTDVREAQQQVNGGIERILSALIAGGTAREDINTDNINIYMYSEYNEQGEERSYYSASSMLTVRVNDPLLAGSVIDTAFDAGANVLNGISFGAENTDESEKEALKNAVENARMKAEALAAAAGVKLEGILSISEGNTFSYDSGANSFTQLKEQAAADGTIVQAARLCVSTQVTVVWRFSEGK